MRRDVRERAVVGLATLLMVSGCGSDDSEPTGLDLTAVASVTITPDTGTVNVGATLQLSATVQNSAGAPLTAAVTWSSSEDGVATVSSSGLVTGVAEGTATITALAGGRSGTMTVTVSDPGDLISVSADTVHFGLHETPTMGEPLSVRIQLNTPGELTLEVRGVIPHVFEGLEYPLLTRSRPALDGDGRGVVDLVFPLAGEHRLDIVLDGQVIGSQGITTSVPTDNVESFEVEEFEAPLSRFSAAGAVVGGEIVIVGGACSTLFNCFSNNYGGSRIQYFDPASREFRVGPYLPDDPFSPQFSDPWQVLLGPGWRAGSLEGRLHVLKEGRHFILGEDGETWVELGPAPELVSESVVVGVGGVLHVLDPEGRMHQYSSDQAEWSENGSWPTAGAHAQGVILDGSIYVLGEDRSLVYEASSGTWSDLPPPPLNMTKFTAAAVNSAVCLIGGGVRLYRSYRDLPHTYCYRPDDPVWRYAGETGGHMWSTAVGFGDGIFVFGGARPGGTAVGYLSGRPDAWLLLPRP